MYIYRGWAVEKCVRLCLCVSVCQESGVGPKSIFLPAVVCACAHTLRVCAHAQTTKQQMHMCASKSVSLQLSIRYTYKIYVYVDVLAIGHLAMQAISRWPAGELKQSMYVKHLIGPNQVHVVVTSLCPSDSTLSD